MVTGPRAASIPLVIVWTEPIPFAQAHSLPKDRGVYAILNRTDLGRRLLRIGATRDASVRPGNYRGAPFPGLPSLEVVFAPVPPEFGPSLAPLLETTHPEFPEDLEWLEYRIETSLLDAYRSRWGHIPPCNFQGGSVRPYLCYVHLQETGSLSVLGLPPAVDLPEDIRNGFRQYERKDRPSR